MCIIHPYDDFKTFPHSICFSKSHKYYNYVKAPCSLVLPSIPPGKSRQVIRLPPGQTNSSSLPQHANRHLLKCTISKSLTHN